MAIRVGLGYDIHRLAPGEEFWLGGIRLEHELGPQGHSDADVLIHAICDALLGAANLRDIGYQFPDTDPKYAGIDSKILLKEVHALVTARGYSIGNIDATVCLQRPKINPHIPAMQECLAEILNMKVEDISLKATTSEQIGFVGREEGISAQAVVLIEK